MDKNHIVTKQDIDELKEFIKETINEKLFTSEKPSSPAYPKWVRAKIAREILQISPNTLKTLRQKNEVEWSYIGSIYYYNYESIMQTLEHNSINKLK